ncbi:FimV/HubP family polar landmark protein [Gynuella sp.]|uniref:FimV/HubP family polar landmark protein n=1 Tax=Gynuella sp. TaxID=2969146 RepID=UPI003D09CD9A
MVRKLATLLPLVVLLGASGAEALGLGELTLKSSLNEPLSAEIDLLQEEDLSSGEILPTLASNQDFQRAGVQRFFFLSNIQFSVLDKGNGQKAIQLSTKQPVQEPFLNFLVEVNWPAGRLLREYTVLLDPPVYDESPVIESEVISPATAAKPSQSSVTTIQNQPSVKFDQNTTTTSQAVPTRKENLKPNQYRVQRDDTLWDISVKFRPDRSLSPQQVMVAIQRSNPSAFMGNNINRLKAGSLLDIPTADQIKSISQSDALAEVSRQNKLLKNPQREDEPTSVPISASGSATSALKDGNEKNPDGYLELVTPKDKTDSASAAGETVAKIDELENKLAMALELNDQYEREKQDLNSRVSELEEQIKLMESMINLQSETGTILENQDSIQANADTNTGPVDQAAVPDAGMGTDDQSSESTSTDTTPVDQGQSEPATTDNTAQEIPTPQPVAPTPPPEPKPVTPPPAPQPEPGIIDMILGSTTNMIAVVLVALMVVLLPFYFISKRKNNQNLVDEDETDFNLDDDEDPFDLGDSDHEMAAEDVDELAEEFNAATSKDDSEEADVVAEADIYIAYGRYDQAEELLKKAIAQDDYRDDVKLKLAEVYTETGNASGFNSMSKALDYADPDIKQKLAELKARMPQDDMAMSSGLEDDSLDLNVSLEDAIDEPEVPTLASETTEAPVSEMEDFDLDLPDDFDTDLSSEDADHGTPKEESDASLDFDLGDNDFSLPTVDEEASVGEKAEENDEFSLDFNLDDFGGDTDDDFGGDTDSESPASNKDEKTESEDFSMDFSLDTDEGLDDLGLDLDSPASETESPREEENPFEALDAQIEALDGLDDFETTAENDLESSSFESMDIGSDDEFSMPTQNEVPELDEVTDLEQDDLSSDLGTGLDGDLDDDFGFLAGADEASTKLDLARAYIDMDDSEGAREILEEVLAEGNDQQKQKAQELIAQLS